MLCISKFVLFTTSNQKIERNPPIERLLCSTLPICFICRVNLYHYQPMYIGLLKTLAQLQHVLRSLICFEICQAELQKCVCGLSVAIQPDQNLASEISAFWSRPFTGLGRKTASSVKCEARQKPSFFTTKQIPRDTLQTHPPMASVKLTPFSSPFPAGHQGCPPITTSFIR